jgi:hypothetical protein
VVDSALGTSLPLWGSSLSKIGSSSVSASDEARRGGMDCGGEDVGCWSKRFMAAVVIGGDTFGVGIVLVMNGACAAIIRDWTRDGPG